MNLRLIRVASAGLLVICVSLTSQLPAQTENPFGPSEKLDLKIFELLHQPSNDLAVLLHGVYTGNQSLTIAADAVGNRLVVKGNKHDLEEIEAVIKRLDQPSDRGNSGSQPQGLRIAPSGTSMDPNVRIVFAPADGEIAKVLVQRDQDVKVGDVLLEIANQELEGNIKLVQAELAVASLALKRAEAANATTANAISQLEIEKLRKESNYAETKLDLLMEGKKKLVIRSPINGTVMTWNAKEQLVNRPVQKGQALLSLGIHPAISDHPVISESSPVANATKNAATSSDARLKSYQDLMKLEKIKLRAQSRRMEYIHVLASSPSDKEARLQKIESQTRTDLEQYFSAVHEQQLQRVRDLEDRLQSLKKSIEDRQKNRETIIEKELKEILQSAGLRSAPHEVLASPEPESIGEQAESAVPEAARRHLEQKQPSP
jgi:multidrug efflux pump subunit AcrA (membrane-fusion protein)